MILPISNSGRLIIIYSYVIYCKSYWEKGKHDDLTLLWYYRNNIKTYIIKVLKKKKKILI